jgi:hypothetical protein
MQDRQRKGKKTEEWSPNALIGCILELSSGFDI